MQGAVFLLFCFSFSSESRSFFLRKTRRKAQKLKKSLLASSDCEVLASSASDRQKLAIEKGYILRHAAHAVVDRSGHDLEIRVIGIRKVVAVAAASVFARLIARHLHDLAVGEQEVERLLAEIDDLAEHGAGRRFEERRVLQLGLRLLGRGEFFFLR